MMAYKNKEAITRMDRVAMTVTGHNAKAALNPRLSILANLIFLAIGITGLFLTARGEIGPTLVFFALMMSSTHTGIAEYQKRGQAPLDEREWGVFWKAMAIGAFATCVFTGFWLMLLSSFADQGMWYPDRPDEWQAAGLFILGLMTQITNIAKARMTPAYAADLIDEE